MQQGKVAAASKKSTRAAKIKVPKLVPYKFPLVSEAKQIKDLVLSKEYIREHGRFVNNGIFLFFNVQQFTKNVCLFQSCHPHHDLLFFISPVRRSCSS